MGLELQLDIGGFKKAIEKVPGELYNQSKSAMNRIGDYYIRKLTVEHLSGHGSNSLARRSSALSRSFNKYTDGSTIDDLALTIYTDSKYARIHEFGGTIRPRKGKYLAIPLDAAKTGAGVSRMSSPRNVAGLNYGGRSKAGNIILRDESGTPMFVLVRQVEIPPRLSMFKTWAEITPVIEGMLNSAIDKALSNAVKE